MDSLSRLVDALRCLPGIGPKSAQRMAYHLLQHHRPRGLHLAICLQEAMHNVRNCDQCNTFTTLPRCSLCEDTNRDRRVLCIVEHPADVGAIEQTHVYKGCYYVLMNKISPLDGIGPEEIGLAKLKNLVLEENIKEVILALSPTVEGQTTMHFICELLKPLNVELSQLAHGIPTGGELEFLDGNTISNALRNRGIISA